MGFLSEGTLERTYYRWFEGGPKEDRFFLTWVLSGSGDNSIIGYLHKSYLQKRQARVQTEVVNGKEDLATHISLERKIFGILWFGKYSYFCLCLDENYKVACFFILVTDWCCLILAFSEIVYAQEGKKKHGLPMSARPASKNTKAKVPDLVPETRAFFYQEKHENCRWLLPWQYFLFSKWIIHQALILPSTEGE